MLALGKISLSLSQSNQADLRYSATKPSVILDHDKSVKLALCMFSTLTESSGKMKPWDEAGIYETS